MMDLTLFSQVARLQREACKLQTLFSSNILTVKQCYNVTKRVNKLITLSEAIDQKCKDSGTQKMCHDNETNKSADTIAANNVTPLKVKKRKKKILNQKCDESETERKGCNGSEKYVKKKKRKVDVTDAALTYEVADPKVENRKKMRKDVSLVSSLTNVPLTTLSRAKEAGAVVKEVIVVTPTEQILKKTEGLKKKKKIKKAKILLPKPVDVIEISEDESEEVLEVTIIEHKTSGRYVVIDDDLPCDIVDLSKGLESSITALKVVEASPPSKSLPKSKTKPSALKKPSDIVICKSCLTIFRTKSGLTAHKPVCQNKEYGKDFNTFDLFEEGSDHPCPICLKNFTSTQLLRSHINTLHGFNVHLGLCHGCGKGFKTFSKLRSHLTRRPACFVRCKICQAKFHARVTNLRAHLRGNHIEKTAICCPHCTKRFNTRLGREVHVAAIHTEERPYKCTKCTRTFAHTIRLTHHMRNSRCSGRVYKCNFCSKTYFAVTSITKHLRSVHNFKDCIKQTDYEVPNIV